jgi:DNA-binding transcriptional ArsR family regulator
MALEEMLSHSVGSDGCCVARVSVRVLAGSLGLAKDTVARAIRRLRDAGVVDVMQPRAESGVFEAGSYRITLPPGITVSAAASLSEPRVRVARRRVLEQLSLLEQG